MPQKVSNGFKWCQHVSTGIMDMQQNFVWCEGDAQRCDSARGPASSHSEWSYGNQLWNQGLLRTFIAPKWMATSQRWSSAIEVLWVLLLLSRFHWPLSLQVLPWAPLRFGGDRTLSTCCISSKSCCGAGTLQTRRWRSCRPSRQFFSNFVTCFQWNFQHLSTLVSIISQHAPCMSAWRRWRTWQPVQLRIKLVAQKLVQRPTYSRVFQQKPKSSWRSWSGQVSNTVTQIDVRKRTVFSFFYQDLGPAKIHPTRWHRCWHLQHDVQRCWHYLWTLGKESHEFTRAAGPAAATDATGFWKHISKDEKGLGSEPTGSSLTISL